MNGEVQVLPVFLLRHDKDFSPGGLIIFSKKFRQPFVQAMLPAKRKNENLKRFRKKSATLNLNRRKNYFKVRSEGGESKQGKRRVIFIFLSADGTRKAKFSPRSLLF
jgi:hypothetical protein